MMFSSDCSRVLCPLLLLLSGASSFHLQVMHHRQPRITVIGSARSTSSQFQIQARRTKTFVEECETFDPLYLASSSDPIERPKRPSTAPSSTNPPLVGTGAKAATTALTALTVSSQQALANTLTIPEGPLDPQSFQPVCPTSDGFYRLLQSSTQAIVGKENFQEYGPLIAGGLLRVRLELCVIESFVSESVVPFVKQNGLSWILPLHETIETFLAGVIFALATTFILIGSTKILTVIVTYTDFLVGLPCRLFGGFFYDRATGKPVTLDVGFGPLKTRVIGPPEKEDGDEVDLTDLRIEKLIPALFSGSIKVVGEGVGLIREVLESIDFFVGRYLVIWATFYILIKFLHYKIFPDFP